MQTGINVKVIPDHADQTLHSNHYTNTNSVNINNLNDPNRLATSIMNTPERPSYKSDLLSIHNSGGEDDLRKSMQQINDLQDQLKRKEHQFIRSFQDLESQRDLDLRKSRYVQEDLEFQRNTLKQESEQLVKLNQELRDLIEEKTRELEKKEKEHEIDLENFKRLCDEMVRNISEEKNRALKKLASQLKQREIEYQLKQGNTEPNTAAYVGENQEQEKSTSRSGDAEEREEFILTQEGVHGHVQEKHKSAYRGNDVDAIEKNRLLEDQEKEIASLKKKIHEVELEREALIEKFKQQETERVHRYEEKINKLEETVKSLEKAALVHTREQEKLQKEVHQTESLRKEVDLLKEESSHKEKEVEVFRSQASGLKDEVELLKGNIENLKEMVGLKEKEIEILQFEVKTAKRNSVRGEEEEAASPEQKEAEIAETEKELEKLREYVAGFEEKLKAEEEKYKEMHQKYQKAVQEEHDAKVEEIKHKLEKVQDEKKEYEKRIKAAEKELESSEQAKGEALAKIKELEEKIVNYALKEDDHKGELEDAIKSRNQLTQKIQGLDKEIEVLQGKLKESTAAEEASRKLLAEEQKKSKELEAKAEKYRTAAEGFEKALNEAVHKNEGVNHEKEVLAHKVKELEKELSKSVQEKEQIEKARGEVSRKLEEAHREKEGIERKLVELEKGAKPLQGDQTSALKSELDKLKREIEDLNKELKEKNASLEEAKKELEEKEKNIKALKTRIGIMSEKVDESERKAKDFESLARNLREIGEKLDISTRQQVASPKAMAGILHEVKEKLRDLDSRLDKEKDKDGNLKKKLEKAQGELTAAKENAQMFKNDLEETQKESNSKIERLERVNRDLEGYLRESQNKISGAERETETVRGNLTKEVQKLELEKEGLRKEIEGYRKTVADMSKDQGAANQTLVARVNEVEAEKKKLEQELWSSRTEVNRVEKEVENMRKELEKSREYFEQERRRLEARLEEEQEEARRARDSMKKASIEAEKAREEWSNREFGSESPIRGQAQVQNIEVSKQKEERKRMARNIPTFDDCEYHTRDVVENVREIVMDNSQPQMRERVVESRDMEISKEGWVTRDSRDEVKVRQSAPISRPKEEAVVREVEGPSGDGWVTRGEIVKERGNIQVGRPQTEERVKISRNYVVNEEDQHEEAPQGDGDGWVQRGAVERTIEKERVIDITRHEDRPRVAKHIPVWDDDDETTFNTTGGKVTEIVHQRGGEDKPVKVYKSLQINTEEIAAQEEALNKVQINLKLSQDENGELKKRVTEIDTQYRQKIEELTQDIQRKEEHINALKSDVAQMKEWIIERHGDDVFEKPEHDGHHHLKPVEASIDEKDRVHSGKSSAPLSAAGGEERELAKSITILLPPAQLSEDWGQHGGILKSPEKSSQGKQAAASDQKKKKKENFSLSWKASKDQQVDMETIFVPKKKDRTHNSMTGSQFNAASLSATPKSVKNSERGSVGTSVSGRAKPEAAYQQLEKMILDLNEKLMNSDKRARADYNVKLEEVTVAFAVKEESFHQEIEKLKEEKRELMKKLDDIQWEHAYEINNMMKKEGTSEPVTPVNNNDAEKKDGEAKKKKKKKK